MVMKTINTFIAIAAGFAVLACSREQVAPASPDVETVVPEEPAVTAGSFVAGFDATKVTMNSSFALNWEENDEVAIFRVKGAEAVKLIYTATSSGAETTLTGDAIDAGATYYAVYPASAAADFDIEGGKPIITLPASQALTANALPSAAVMVSTCSGSTPQLTFKNVGALIEFTIGTADVVRTVTFQGTGSENVAGTGSVSAGAAPAVSSLSTAAKSLVLTPAAGSTFAAGTYYAAVLPGAFSGINVKLYDTDGKEVSLSTTIEGGSIARSSRLTLGTITGVKDFAYNRTISDAAQFVNFLERAADDGNETWTIANDIDLAGVEIPAAASFAGTLNGGSRTINNLALTGPLFTTLSGTVKDLTIGSGSRLTVPGETGSYAFIAGNNTGTITGVTTNGVITAPNQIVPAEASAAPVYIAAVAAVNTGNITSTTNNASVTVNANNIGKFVSGDGIFVAGVVADLVGGQLGSTTEDNDIVNNGTISFQPNGSSAANYIGGVCARKKNGADATLGRCKNTGKIVFNVSAKGSENWLAKVGGVIGMCYTNIDHCVNEGQIDFDSSKSLEVGKALRNTVVGGVAGAVYGNATNCSNTSSISVDGTFGSSTTGTNALNFYVGGVVAFEGNNSTSFESCTNSGDVTVDARFNETDGSHSTKLYCGGVVGYANKANMTICTNSGDLIVNSTLTTSYVGGLTGYSGLKILNSTNSGDVLFDFINNTASGTQSKQLYMGGISGHHDITNPSSNHNRETHQITNTFNTSEVDISVSHGFESDLISYIGGVVGFSTSRIMGTSSSSPCSDYSTINIDSPVKCYVGGIAGSTGYSVLDIHYRGSITVENVAEYSAVGGRVGYKTGTNDARSHQYGNVSVTSESNVYAGMLYGYVTAGMTTHTHEILATLTGKKGYCGVIAGGIDDEVTVKCGNGTSAKCTIKDGCIVNGTTLTSDNYADYLKGTTTGSLNTDNLAFN